MGASLRTSTTIRRSRHPRIGEPFDEMMGMAPWVGDVIRLGVHAGSSYFGFHVGSRETGFASGAGYTIGVVNGVGAILDLIALLGRL